jgi:hypothetical protein
MNLELIYAAAFVFAAFGITAEVMEAPRLTIWSFFLAALMFGFATGWWAYSKYHGVFQHV